ncbi:cytochrome C assembly family protein [Undibacterium griseum]|uniref:Cytochrome c biogenesis protein CcsA n=1 Tax=Undibacterium griseum TaxID=2762295 RepID=A0ABR6YNH3_9BURK|nr:cytochrome c biogenesis protein CcsA [Undibacterium griseum]MBC3885442.1 cytochrome c biogenesis protein CcsA [Undibacterium griseum]
MQIYLSFLAALMYLAALAIPLTRRRLAASAGMLAWLLHGVSLWQALLAGDALRVGFAVMLSAALWVTVSVYLVENRNVALDGLKFFIFPPAVAVVVLPAIFPGNMIALTGKTTMFPWHVAVALLAYSTLTIAAFHAVIMSLQDKHLHKLQSQTRPWLNAVIDKLPALMTMEKVLFHMITLGFILLTLTVLSGVVFSEQVLGVAFKWDHKTILSLLSWLLFAILLAGRHWRGWRGRTVLNFTLTGFLTLLLAYVGSRFVLEVLLHRSLT